MDGEIKFASADSGTADALVHQRDTMDRPALGRPRTVRWFVIIGLALLVVLGALYGFNRYRSQAIATFFANNKPPPASVSIADATTEVIPNLLTAVGDLAAVHQVNVTTDVSGRITDIMFTAGSTVTAGSPLVQLFDGPEQGDLASFKAQATVAQLSLDRAIRSEERRVGKECERLCRSRWSPYH